MLLVLLLLLALARAAAAAAAVSAGAYTILFREDLDQPTFPANLLFAKVLVVQPAWFSPSDIATVRAALPGVTLLSYFDFEHVPIRDGCSTGHVMGDRANRTCNSFPGSWPTYSCNASAYQDALQQVFSPLWAVRNLTAGAVPVCTYPGLAHFVPNRNSTLPLVSFVAAWVEFLGTDGVYLDGFMNGDVTRTVYEQYFAAGDMDADGDGVAESVGTMLAVYSTWAPLLVHALRARLGAARLLVSNSAGPLGSDALNGITIEMQYCDGAPQMCHDFVAAQEAMGAQPPLGIFWLTHPEVVPAQRQCELVALFQQSFPFMLAGVVPFDGSFITCANSTQR